MQCELCKGETVKENIFRYAALNICKLCDSNIEIYKRLKKSRKFNIIEDSKTYHLQSGIIVVWTIKYKIDFDINMKMVLKKEGIVSAVHKIFKNELEIGDHIFDDAIWIRGNPEEQVKNFLNHEGMQTVILELVGNGGILKIDRDYLEYYIESGSSNRSLNCAILVHYLEQYKDIKGFS